VDQACPGCGVILPAHDGPVHRYMESSPACWAEYGKVLAREYGDPELMAGCHRLTTDTFAVQHPGKPSPQSIQSVAIHLMALHAVLELGSTHDEARALLSRAADRMTFKWLDRPANLGNVTAADVARAGSNAEHMDAVKSWANAAWRAWAPHHSQVRAWAEEARAA
jgi:hypothetical protein